MYAERRTSKRLDQSHRSNLFVSLKDSFEFEFKGKVLDVSKTGIRLVVRNKMVSTNDILEFVSHYASFKVVWSQGRHIENDWYFELGLEVCPTVELPIGSSNNISEKKTLQ